MILQEIHEHDKTEHARSEHKHGKWKDRISDDRQFVAIEGEFEEWKQAYFEGDINGEHGEIQELLHLRNV